MYSPIRDLHGPGGPVGQAGTGRSGAGLSNRLSAWNGPGRAGLSQQTCSCILQIPENILDLMHGFNANKIKVSLNRRIQGLHVLCFITR